MPIAYAIKVVPHWTYGGKGPGSPTEFNGFIPDGVSRLILEFGHGAARAITVRENAFGVSLRQIPRAIKFREPSGATGVVQVGS
jgi:hypothetical protein